ncbi:MAG: deoxyribodipyrimidine photo-lyase [Bacteroidales bacterium]|nr:deoxyribodipyrimidine photo-lyase [Bacteroidales bacterium]MDD4673657.1 deoxyribodipyrimidine photo-lyase [Bacteroidales bacterium]MDY0348313.1 deoxyribodipyrimidine photo-lyase [Tenuifilaceae bacterium]
MVDKTRVTHINEAEHKQLGPVVYWMSRDQRVNSNWALLYAIEKANEKNVPVYVVFSLFNPFLNAQPKHFQFLLNGLLSVERLCKEHGISFSILLGHPPSTISQFIADVDASLLVSDFDPLRIKRQWKNQLNNAIRIAHHEVDAHNIVPCRIVSPKLEYAAYTFRPKITKRLPIYLVGFPSIPLVTSKVYAKPADWQAVFEYVGLNNNPVHVDYFNSGEDFAIAALERFINSNLTGYNKQRNNPLANGQSGLSPYLHFGQLSAQHVAIEVTRANVPTEDKSSFLEELIVRRELSDNFCYYNPDYDSTSGFHRWAQDTHSTHRLDEREYTYPLSEFEQARTHDNLWNAAQLEMVKTGKMHGYLRMYWAKKILEWTLSPEQAMEFAIHLNDKYSLDGRDPNGYAGIAWSIGGVHDRAWATRPVFGKIRYMNRNGCKRKFDVEAYIATVYSL